MTFAYLLAGILIAATLFGSVLWALAQAFQAPGRLRSAYIVLALLTIGGMAAASYGAGIEMRIVGAALVAVGAYAVRAEQGSARLLPFVQLLFGLFLLFGLPLTYLSG